MLKPLDLDLVMGSSNVGMIEHGIFVKRRALKSPDKVVEDLEKVNKWERSEVFSGVSQHRSNYQVHLTKLCNTTEPHLSTHDKSLFEAFKKGISQYRSFNPHLEIERDEGIVVLKYASKEEYKEHVDDGRTSHRRLSGLIYLNDKFVGGNLVFPRQNISIRPEPGMLVLFPSGFAYPHVAKPVKRGVRFVAVTWFS